MILNTLQYKNYCGLEDGRIDFSERLTVFVGKNGTGKTSILNAIAIAISWIISKMRSEKGIGNYVPDNAITNGRLHSCIEASFDEIPSIQIPNKLKSGIVKQYQLDIEGIKQYSTAKRAVISEDGTNKNLPVFVFYGVKRAVIDIPLRIRGKKHEILESYDDCLNGAANFRAFFMWFREQEDLENEYIRWGSDLFDEKHNTITPLQVFRDAMKVFVPEYSDFHIRRNPLRMVVKKDGKELNVAQLSDGEKIYLALIGDLCRRLTLANPNSQNPLKGEGVVLIDEIDLHLHPLWQSQIASRLLKVFPNIQFIVTTHSPHVVNRVDTESIRLLSDGVVNNAVYGYGMPSEVILKDLMGLEFDQPEDIESILNSFYSLIARGRIEDAIKTKTRLLELVPNHPELPRFEKILERKMR